MFGEIGVVIGGEYCVGVILYCGEVDVVGVV